MSATVYVVDDDVSMRRSLGRLLRSLGYRVEAFFSGESFLEHRRDARPACAVVDLRMPGIDGLELAARLRAAGDELPLIYVTGHGDVASSVRAMKDGAIDFLTKPFDVQVLQVAIQRALDQDTLARASREALEALSQRFDALTPREREVCELVAEGLLNKQVADRLGTTEKTVKVHRARVMDKLGARSVADLVRMVDRLRAADVARRPAHWTKVQ